MPKEKRASSKAGGAPPPPSSGSRAKAPPPTTPPSWPAFKPQLPVCDLGVESLVESKIVVLRNFWPRSLCRDYVSFLRTLPLVTTPGKPKRGEAVRVNDRFQMDDALFAERLWLQTGLKEALLEDPEFADLWGGEALGLSPNIRVYRYSKNQYFDYDDSNTLTWSTPSSADPPIQAKTTWTLLLYLTSSADGVTGGETVFYPHDRKLEREAIPVALETGMLLLHKHGDDCLLHEGKEVTAGEKWVLRTDLCVRK